MLSLMGKIIQNDLIKMVIESRVYDLIYQQNSRFETFDLIWT